MRILFKTTALKELYESEKGARKYPTQVVENYIEVVTLIQDAPDERDLYALKSLHYEKLVGDRDGQRSLRLNRQWRLIVVSTRDDDGAMIEVVEIEDYH